MQPVTHVTRNGTPWEPSYLDSIDQKTCIGCGRCFKVCGQDVMKMAGIDEDGQLVDDPDDGEVERTVMTVANPGNCTGCGACGRVCAKKAQSRVSG